MSVETALWKVGARPEKLTLSVLPSERLLEDMIVAAPQLLSEGWMLIGRQEDTGYGGRIDLLAIAPDASLVLVELKRDRTPREVIAQALDYAGWVEQLEAEAIRTIYSRFRPGCDLAEDFKSFHGTDLLYETLSPSYENYQNPRIVIVASGIDASTERILNYLKAWNVPIDILIFQVFANSGEQLLSRSWLVDPLQTPVNKAASAARVSEPWNGEYYCSFGESETRSWAEAVEFGFFCAGGGVWYSRTLQLLKPGDRIWVKIPGKGFVGVGRVTGRAVSALDFTIEADGVEQPILSGNRKGNYHSQFKDDLEKCEYFVPVTWLQTVPSERAVQEIGFFGNQNSVCAPKTASWRSTINRLKVVFPRFES